MSGINKQTACSRCQSIADISFEHNAKIELCQVCGNVCIQKSDGETSFIEGYGSFCIVMNNGAAQLSTFTSLPKKEHIEGLLEVLSDENVDKEKSYLIIYLDNKIQVLFGKKPAPYQNPLLITADQGPIFTIKSSLT